MPSPPRLRTSLWSRSGTLPGLLAIALLGAGCLNLKPKPDLTRYYLLGRTVAEAESVAEPGASRFRLFVERVEVPGYLELREMATRGEGGEITYATTHRWAEALDEGITRVLRDDLARQLGVGSMVPTRVRRPVGVFHELRARISRFEWTTGRKAVIEAQWEMVEQPAGAQVLVGKTLIVRDVDPGRLDYAGGVAALSDCLEAWAAELAVAVGDLALEGRVERGPRLP